MSIIRPEQTIKNMWLVKLFEDNPEGLDLETILKRYRFRPPFPGDKVGERTIHNWIKELDEKYNIKISCGKGKKIYHIENDDYLDDPYVKQVREWTNNWGKISVIDNSRCKKSGMSPYGELSLGFLQVGNSMLNGESMAIRYGKKHDKIGFNEPCIFKPFFTKVIENECYVIGEIRPVSGLWSERIEVYSLDRLSVIEDGDFQVENYTIPFDFTPTNYYIDTTKSHFKKYSNKPMAVFLDAHNDTADYLREHPIAPTQTEIESNRTINKNIFMVVVKPNEDFFTQILSFGKDLTITNPDFLKREGEDLKRGNTPPFRYQRYEEDLIGYDYRYFDAINQMKRSGIGVNRLLQSKYGGLTDAKLVTKYQNGEEGAFEVLSKRYYDNTFRYLQNLPYDYSLDKYHADHLNSVTWEKVSVALLKGQYQESEKFENWVKVIAKRTFLNWREKEEKELPTVSFDYDENQTGGEDENLRLQIQGEVEDPERAIEKKETTEVLGKLIADLPHDLKRVLELDQKGYTYDDIAKMEGLPVSTIAQRYKRAVRAIQDMLF